MEAYFLGKYSLSSPLRVAPSDGPKQIASHGHGYFQQIRFYAVTAKIKTYNSQALKEQRRALGCCRCAMGLLSVTKIFSPTWVHSPSRSSNITLGSVALSFEKQDFWIQQIEFKIKLWLDTLTNGLVEPEAEGLPLRAFSVNCQTDWWVWYGRHSVG
ncbi:hypothetical protein SLEP1_g2758 [Rubroshorea leprosula]|uniref:Uncharacterized protein n=1 Tax=Rubroshorea leprosula TaxID=152421 RepID=A0AAV5HRG8_9ROSI|nr:hypothetical protein SLEP1_g2758 [Rubroshorea leprosula]